MRLKSKHVRHKYFWRRWKTISINTKEGQEHLFFFQGDKHFIVLYLKCNDLCNYSNITLLCRGLECHTLKSVVKTMGGWRWGVGGQQGRTTINPSHSEVQIFCIRKDYAVWVRKKTSIFHKAERKVAELNKIPVNRSLLVSFKRWIPSSKMNSRCCIFICSN